MLFKNPDQPNFEYQSGWSTKNGEDYRGYLIRHGYRVEYGGPSIAVVLIHDQEYRLVGETVTVEEARSVIDKYLDIWIKE
jgi:hypothetical protein